MTIEEYRSIAKDDSSLVSEGVITLKKGEGRTIKAGGAWVYDNEIASVSGSFENGDIVAVNDFDGYFLGFGFINNSSRIRIRILSRKKEHLITPSFIYDRVLAAWNYRKAVIDTSSCRVIFGEADFLPGLTVDKYEDVLVAESLALGLEKQHYIPSLGKDFDLKTLCLAYLVQILENDGINIRGIYERSDAKVRDKEALPRVKAFLSEPFDTNVPIVENGVRYIVDVKDGQKTGFFLDQKLNRLSIHKICENAGSVLDCFTHTGSFGLNAAIAGAEHVVSIDASDLAIEQARENARLNGLDERIEYVVGDVFDFLPSQVREGKQYDVVILDPPAFTKSRNSIKAAYKGYREINAEGLRLVKNGGYLATCSCSHFMDPEMFSDAIAKAARDAHKRLRQIEFRQQAPDHPILWANETSYYLKFLIFQVVDEM